MNKRLLFPSELQLEYYLTKYQSDWICDLYSRRSVCIYYQVCLSVCPSVCLFISLTFTSTLVGGDIKFIQHDSSTKPFTLPRLS